MSQKIASLYADIGANTTGLKQGLGETKTGLQKAASDFSSFQSKALTVFAGVGAAVFAAKKAFDFAKEGAQIDLISGKFDRLAESAGATGDALLQSLRNATRDTVSDVQLMASATDFLGLGLAKTADETIRMTRVAGALGMNMNQLVLTLTNQTTMRFDALGVAVDGFDEKVKTLKETGMDANAAFTEAFLQQAEAQIEKVGDIADTSAGQIMQLEAAWRNFIDANKEAAAGFAGTTTGITGTLKYMGLLRQAVNDGRMSLAEANLEMLRWGMGAKDADQAIGELQAETVDLAVASKKASKAIDAASLSQEGMAKNAEAAAKGLNDEIGFMEGLEGAAGRVQGILDALDVTISPELDLGAVTNQIMASGAIQKLGEAFSKGLISETQYKQAFAEVATTLGDMTAEQVQKAFSLFDIQSLFDQTVEGAPDQVPAALQSYIDSLRGLSDTDYSAQEEMASSAEIMAEKLPAAATGAEDLAAGLGNAQQPAQNFSDLVNNELEPGISNAEKATQKWVEYIAELEDKTVTITYNEEHNISYNYSSNGGGGGGGPGYAGGGMSNLPEGYASGGNPPVGSASLVGENGPELFVPNMAGSIYPNGSFSSGGGGGNYIDQSRQTFIVADNGMAALTSTLLSRSRRERSRALMGVGV